MKKMFFAVATMLFSFAVSAAPLTDNFVCDNGKVIGIHDSLAVEKGSGVVLNTAANTAQFSCPDATGAVWNKIVASAGFSARFVQRPGTFQYWNASKLIETTCSASTSYLSYPTNGGPYAFADGCAFHQAIKAVSN